MIVAICDDDSNIRNSLKEFLIKYKKERRIHLDIMEFSNGDTLLQSEYTFDIIFLDYQMPNLNGMDIARELRKRKNSCSIIFITSYPAFVIQAFEVNTFRFHVKPINYQKLSEDIDFYIKEQKMFAPVVINTDGEQFVINSEDIVYLKGCGKYCYVRTNNNTYRSSKTISGVYDLLPKQCFFRTHKSYVVNFYCVEVIKDNIIELSNGEKVKLSRDIKKDFKNAYLNFIKNFNPR